MDEANLPVHIRARMATAAKQATASTQFQEAALQTTASAGPTMRATPEQVQRSMLQCLCVHLYVALCHTPVKHIDLVTKAFGQRSHVLFAGVSST